MICHPIGLLRWLRNPWSFDRFRSNNEATNKPTMLSKTNRLVADYGKIGEQFCASADRRWRDRFAIGLPVILPPSVSPP